MPKCRVACFIDGFNLYHSIDDTGDHYLKWVDLRKLMECFIDPDIHEIVAVYYFSAFAEWLDGPSRRHKEYVKALINCGVTPVMGNFKEKPNSCLKCGNRWIRHEEKQSDVNIAVSLVREAFRNNYDQAFLVSCDSDFSPALEFLNELPKKRQIKIVSPLGRMHSKELCGFSNRRPAKIKKVHLERCLLPAEIIEGKGNVIAGRPDKYNPPKDEN